MNGFGRRRAVAAALTACAACAAFAACRAAALPVDRFFRLELPAVSPAGPSLRGVLRVHDLQLATALDGDAMLVADGVRIAARTGERWCAPPDRLVTDALLQALARAEVCTLVKGAADPGHETWSLHGRVLEFAEVATPRGAAARAALELWIEAGGEVLLRGEFAAAVPLSERTAEAAAAGLARALHEIATRLASRLRAECTAEPAASPR